MASKVVNAFVSLTQLLNLYFESLTDFQSTT